MKKREKKLLLIVIVIALLGSAGIGWDFFSKRQSLLLAEKSRLETEWVKIDALFEEKEIWDARASWLKSNQPTFKSIGQIDQAIFRKAEAKDVEGIVSKPLSSLPSVQTAYYTQAGIALSVEGKHEDVFRWIYGLQRPDEFHVVRNLKISVHKKEAEKIVCQFELLRWYAPETQN